MLLYWYYYVKFCNRCMIIKCTQFWKSYICRVYDHSFFFVVVVFFAILNHKIPRLKKNLLFLLTDFIVS